MKQRVCIVASSSLTINAFLIEPIKKLCKHYQVEIVVNDDPGAISSELQAVKVESIPIQRTISPFLDLVALVKLIRFFRDQDFKVVQSVTPKAGLLAMLASYIARVNIRIHIFTGQVWVTRRGSSRWILKQMDRMIHFLATDILIDSASQRQFLLEQRVVNTTRSSVLANGSISGVDTSRFKPDARARLDIRRKLDIDEKCIVFLFIGRLNRDKGVLDLAAAFSNITGDDARLLVVGPDEAGIQSEMESILENCLERVYFIGYSSDPEKYMAASDLLCLPSYREGFGSVVLEAAATGIPAIGSRIYGVEDAIVDGQTGFLFEAGNIEELYERMMSGITDVSIISILGENARKRVLEEFTSEILASAWLDYYQAKL